MRSFARLTLILAAVAGLASVGTLPAQAVADETTTTVTIEEDVLSISVPSSVAMSTVTHG